MGVALITRNVTAKHGTSGGTGATGSRSLSIAGSMWSASVTPAYRDQDFVITLGWQRSEPLPNTIQLLDRTTGALDGTIRVNYNPFVLRRPAQHELLVSYGAPSPGLLVFDTANRLALKRQISLPDRVDYTVYAPYGMALSGNQRYLFYLTHETHSELPACHLPGNDAAVCDLNAVATVDLARGAVTAHTSLPQNCGYASLNAASASDVVAMCTNTGPIQELNERGQVVKQGDMGGRGLFGFVTAQGTLAAVLRDGTVILPNQNGSHDRVAALPSGARVDPTSQVVMYAPGQLFIPYRLSAQENVEGFVLFDVVARKVQRDAIVSGSLYVTARPGELLTLLTTGAVQRLDPAAAAGTTSITTAGVAVSWSVQTSTDVWALVP